MSNIFERFDLKGRAAIITGGAGLLGKEFCRTLAQAGAQVVVADLNIVASQAVAKDLQQEDLTALPVGVDVTDPGSVQAMVRTTLEALQRLDILVNSAAVDPKFDDAHQDKHTNSFEDYPLSAWKHAIDVNLTGMFLCCQAAARQMLAQKRGVIINICSIYGMVGPDQRIYQFPGQAVQYKPAYYSVTKAGVLGLTRYLATYFAGQNIRVNALTPGGVYNNHDEVFVQNYSARAVLGRMAQRDEMNGALLFLVSDASSYMTGANLVVDGGWTAW
jgi:2-deoxy-D-gluconate 3-dehydrogenase